MGFTQSGMPTKTAGRSIKRMVQPRKLSPDGNSWESPDAGQTCIQAGYTPIFYDYGEGQGVQGSKGHEHLRRTRGKASGMR
jgi:hypothetical protein